MDIDQTAANDAAETETYQEPSLGAEIGKAFAVSAIASVGTVVGFLATSYAIGKVQEIRSKRRAAKQPLALETPTTPTETDA